MRVSAGSFSMRIAPRSPAAALSVNSSIQLVVSPSGYLPSLLFFESLGSGLISDTSFWRFRLAMISLGNLSLG